MTNAPADLLGLRAQFQHLAGLSAVDVGIVGDAAHARSGGYHIGRSGLVAAGMWSSDYSVRLTRDRNGATESASAMDVGAGWGQGRAVWLRWNNLFANALRSGDPALAAVRGINYSPDGQLKWRIDREQGFRTESSSDTVDIHTHIEWYRDTEGHRQQSLDRIAALAQQAITGQLAPTGVDVSTDDFIDSFRAGITHAADGKPVAPVDWQIKREAREKAADAVQAQILSGVKAIGAPDPAAIAAALAGNAAFVSAITSSLAGLVPTVEELRAVVDAAVKARLDGATVHTAGT